MREHEKDDDQLVEKGRLSYEWARRHMPLFRLAEKRIRSDISQTKDRNPFSDLKIAACLHVSKETSVLIKSLSDFGAKIRLVAANPLSSQPEIVAYLCSKNIDVRAKRNETASEYSAEILEAAKSEPALIIDDGGELHVAYSKIHSKSCIGGTDETTSGTTRLRALVRKGKLRYPVIAVNEASTKHIFDNKYGTGQSAIDGLLRATGLLIAGKTIVVVGFGWVGRGVALRAKGMGARVIVTEVDPVKALEAHLEGYEVMRMDEASHLGEIFLTCTGQTAVIAEKDFLRMVDGAIIANVGHFDVEIDVRALYRISNTIEQVRDNVGRFEIHMSKSKSKSLFLLNQGRVVNLGSAEGHPPEVMQLSFANQLLCIYYLAKNREKSNQFENKVLGVPDEINQLVAKLSLNAFNVRIDKLSSKQRRYATSFNLKGSA